MKVCDLKDQTMYHRLLITHPEHDSKQATTVKETATHIKEGRKDFGVLTSSLALSS